MKRAAYFEFALILIPVFGIQFAARAQTNRPTPATLPTAIVEGRVVSPEGHPLQGAAISIYDEFTSASASPLLATGKTDAQGNFKIPVRAERTVVVGVEADGYGLCLVHAAVNVDDDPLEIPLKPPATVRVRVVNTDGAPVAGVTVAPAYFRNAPADSTAAVPNSLQKRLARTTDATGWCAFPGMPRLSQIAFEVSEEWTYRSASNVQTTDTDTLDAPDSIPFQLGAIIEGRVICADTGKPAAGVRIRDRGLAGGVLFVTSDDDGKFRFTHLRAGQHLLDPNIDYPLNRQYCAEKQDPIDLTAGQTLKDQEIRLVAGTAIHGKATIEGTEQPAAGVAVELFVQTSVSSSTGISAGRTEADGTYMFRALPGIYKVDSISAIRGSLVAVRRDPRQFFTLEAGKEVTFDLQFRPNTAAQRNAAGPVKGTVFDERGNPIEGARVTLSYGTDYHLQDVIIGPGGGIDAPAMGDGSKTFTDASGRFELPVAANGAILRARKGNLALLQPITIGPDRDLKLRLSANAAGSAVVRVVDEHDQPLGGVEVAIRVSDATEKLAPRWGTTGPDGIFALAPVYADRNYRVTAGGNSFTTGTGSFSAIAGARVEVPPIKLIKADGSIAGRVVNQNGQALASVQVMLSGGQAGSKSVHTDAKGNFRFDTLVPGDEVSIRTNVEGGVSDPISAKVGAKDMAITHIPRASRGSPGAARRGAAAAP